MRKLIIKRKNNIKPFKARDGALIYEIFTKTKPAIKNIGLASGILKPNKKALPHFHKISEEIYYVISGKGRINIAEKKFSVREGDAAYIPRNTTHALENISRKKLLSVLCISVPPYKEKDFIFSKNNRVKQFNYNTEIDSER